jgi:hypothetical protein
VSVRPLRHNQYERFISSAYPYYASAFRYPYHNSALFLFQEAETAYKKETFQAGLRRNFSNVWSFSALDQWDPDTVNADQKRCILWRSELAWKST